jgi:hypothetical protein
VLPVIMPEEQFAAWAGPEAMGTLQRPYAPEEMTAFPISRVHCKAVGLTESCRADRLLPADQPCRVAGSAQMAVEEQGALGSTDFRVVLHEAPAGGRRRIPCQN